jgi:hypothetical protein
MITDTVYRDSERALGCGRADVCGRYTDSEIYDVCGRAECAPGDSTSST